MRNGYYKCSDGHQEWYLNGERHREDGPAVIYPDGTKEWYKNGKIHREDGPAYIENSGYKSWWENDELHREDGPAVIYSNGHQRWYLNGKDITKEVTLWFEECNLTYETLEFEDKMALKFYIRGLAT